MTLHCTVHAVNPRAPDHQARVGGASDTREAHVPDHQVPMCGHVSQAHLHVPPPVTCTQWSQHRRDVDGGMGRAKNGLKQTPALE
jgi:hypothetical protein